MRIHRLLRWAKNRRAPLWDPASCPPYGQVRFDSELKTAAQIMDISRHESQRELGVPSSATVSETGAAA